MPQLQDLLFLLPIFVTALIGASIQDFVITFSPTGKGDRYLTRIARILSGAILSTLLIGLGGSLIFPTADWKLSLLASFITGFAGFRLASVFAKTTAGLDLIGLKSIGDAMKLGDKEIDERDQITNLKKELKEKNEIIRSKDSNR